MHFIKNFFKASAKLFLGIVTIIIVVLIYFQITKYKPHNEISFSIPKDEIVDSLQVAKSYLLKSDIQNNEVTNFFWNKEELYINNKKIGSINNLGSGYATLLPESRLKENEIKRYINNIRFLKNHEIFGAYLKHGTKQVLFKFGENPGNEYETDRRLILETDQEVANSLIGEYEIIDKAPPLYLLKHKD